MAEQKIHNLNKLLLNEVLKMINADPSLMDRGKPFAFQQNSALHKVFYYGYVPKARFLLPEGVPPFTPSNMKAGVDSTDLLIAIRRGRLSYMVDKSIPSARREQLYISLLETVNAEEAKVLLAIKDQTIDQLYPNLTYKCLYEHGYLPYDEQKCQEPTKSNQTEEQSEPDPKPANKPRRSNTRKTSKK